MSSGFITESEVAEARKKRQEEWEKVRQPDEPMGNETIHHINSFNDLCFDLEYSLIV